MAQNEAEGHDNTLSLSDDWDELFSSTRERKHSFLFMKPFLCVVKNNMYVYFVSEFSIHLIRSLLIQAYPCLISASLCRQMLDTVTDEGFSHRFYDKRKNYLCVSQGGPESVLF